MRIICVLFSLLDLTFAEWVQVDDLTFEKKKEKKKGSGENNNRAGCR